MDNDWIVFRAACWALLTGQNPYLVGHGQMRFFNPPWTLIPLMPLALFPPTIGYYLNMLVSLVSLLLVARHLKLGLWEFVCLAISPMHVQSVMDGNIEWVPLLGLLMPPPLAVLFYATKPQAGMGLIFLVLLKQWEKAQWRGIISALLPTVVCEIIALGLWGLPPVPAQGNWGQLSLFPYSLLLGLPALFLTWKTRREDIAAFVGPFVAPYVTFHGYLPALLVIRGKWRWLVVVALYAGFLYLNTL